MLTLSYLITRSAGSIRWASRWHRQVTGWGQGQTPRWVGGWASVPLQSRSWDYRARGLVLTAPGPKCSLPGPGEGESLQALSPVALSSLGTGWDRPAGTPQRALSLPVAAEDIEARRKEGPRVTAPGREPRPRGSQSSRLATGAAPLQLLASPSTLGLCFPTWQRSVLVRQAHGASTVVLLVAQGSWETWSWLRNVRWLPQTDEGAAEVQNSRARWGPARCPGPGS